MAGPNDVLQGEAPPNLAPLAKIALSHEAGVSVSGADYPFSFYFPVWGEAYVNTFLNYALPMLMAPNNLPGLRGKKGQFVVYTTREGKNRIAQDPLWKRLETLIPARFKLIDDEKSPMDVLNNNKYRGITVCYIDALNDAYETRSAAVMLMSDFAISDGSIAEYRALVDQGVRAIEVVCPRSQARLLKAGLENHRLADGSISIDPHSLSNLWFRNMHPVLDAHIVEGPEGEPFHPSHLYWRVGNEGILVRILHAHPILVVPKSPPGEFISTTDYGLVDTLGFTSSEVHLSRDSRTSFCCEMSPPGISRPRSSLRGDLAGYNEFFNINPEHNIRRLFLDVMITTTPTPDLEKWAVVREESKAFIIHLDELRREEALRAKRGWWSRLHRRLVGA